ncbi:MAG TPA: peptidoglycan-binding domain-containing protein [Streptosporangiaceae bacterium]|nr:peptidoglycan-binding domain-containing protein [Streptosporangiaceae bacterium]
MTADREPGRPRRRAGAVAGLAAALAALAAVAAGIVPGRPAPRTGAAAAAVATSSAPVVRADLTSTIQVAGTLGYTGSRTIVDQASGTAFTALPAAGAVVRRGQALYEVDGTPVILFYGTRPAWRALYAGVAAGSDVTQLDRNLIALGFGGGLTVSGYFTAATAYAVERWQAARGLPVTGTVPLGQVAYAPGALRVTAVTAVPGAPSQPGTGVLTATSTAPVVLAQVPVSQEYLVRAGDDVTVTLPDGVTVTPGIVTAVSPVASTAPGGGSGQDQGQAAGQGAGQATVQVTIRLGRPAAAGRLDQAPVTVGIVSARARGVLAVPVSALVALAGGGYAVDVVHGQGRHLVAVRTGLFAQTLVQVSGPGLAAGQRVEVPAP